MTAQANDRPPITTVHLVYPHGESISTPDAIGRNLGSRLARYYRVIYHDWADTYAIASEPDAALVGHPHPSRGTVFRRSASQPGWRRVLMLAPFNGDAAQVAFEDRVIRDCDLFLAIAGPYWFQELERSVVAHWAPKMRRLDLAVDRTDFPPVKLRFNPQGGRRFLYIGHLGRMKNVDYLAEIARHTPGVEFAAVGPGRDELPASLRGLGPQDFSRRAARDLVADYDFLITVGRADANPTTVLEGMSWGLIPVCTPQSGYADVKGILNVPLDDAAAASAAIGEFQSWPETDLRHLQKTNWDSLDQQYTWDRFAFQVRKYIESTESPEVGHEGVLRHLQLAFAAATSPQTSAARQLARRALGSARRRMGTSTAPAKGGDRHRTSRDDEWRAAAR